ncbi:MAG: hypothetical protein RL434_2239 [Pseudomonadota bacterium]|jgi:hypothetical protein
MQADTAKLTIRLPREDLDFAKTFAKAHGVSVTEVIDRYLRLLRHQVVKPGPEVLRITGLIPDDVDGVDEYQRYLHEKHSA